MSDFPYLVSRRSVYDLKARVVGYQVMVQDPVAEASSSDVVPPDFSMDHLDFLFSDETLKEMIGSEQVFVDINANILEQAAQNSPNIPKTRLILGITEANLLLDQDVFEKIKILFEQDYCLSFSGFWSSESFESLFNYSKIYRLNPSLLSAEELDDRFVRLKNFQKDIKIFAEHIDTHESFEHCKKLECAFFEGKFLSLPNLENNQNVTTSKLAAMRLLTALDNPNISVREVEDLLSQDSRMSYKLLRIINSAAYGMPRTINSLREAVVYMGLQQIKSWAGVAILSSVEEKPKDLLLTTMIRARMCELIGDLIGAEDSKSFFTVGLFSTLDALLDKTMEEVLKEVSLSEEIKEALLGRSGEMGEVLGVVIAYEQGQWDTVRSCGLEPKNVSDLYLKSVHWASTSFRELKG